jgi:predicted enzyme related to lactoylglutathione lyase
MCWSRLDDQRVARVPVPPDRGTPTIRFVSKRSVTDGSDESALGELVYLYLGTDDVARDLAFYQTAIGARLVWRFDAFGTDVAAVRLGPGPLVLLAEHRRAPSCLPIWSVADLDAATERLAGSGFEAHGETVGTPDGPVHVLRDPSGNELGLLRADRPGALEQAYADPTNTNAVR